MTPDGQDLFSNPRNEAAVNAAWASFLSGEEPSAHALRTLVDASWQRCLSANVDPRSRSAPDPLSEGDLFLLRERQQELLDASAPIMACARDFLSETGTLLALADTHCTILCTEGDGPALHSAETIHLMPGVAWTEAVCGTNAIGTALAVGKPVQIHSTEHFCEGIKRWTCSATVLRHPSDGEIVGVLDASGLSQTYNRQTLALVVTAASRIESRLAAAETELRYHLLDRAMARLSSQDGVVLFDRRGNMVRANEHAASAIDVVGGDAQLLHQRHAPWVRAGRRGLATPQTLPPWMNPEWIEPLYLDGKPLGSVLILPHRSAGIRRPSTPNIRPSTRTAATDLRSDDAFNGIVTVDPGLQDCISKARRLAQTPMPVLLLGETGSGKEEFARGIHGASSAPFVALNCGGLSRELLASELFGYAEGSFTGARKGGMVGKIEAANGGTLFLDEIGEMPLDMQPNLLRVLEQGELYRLGENTPRKVHFRLISATHRDLRQEIDEGHFRMDLFYRIAVTSLRLPPLRQRQGDVETLARHFLTHFCAQHGKNPMDLSADAWQAMHSYAWPGNVRELRNTIECAVLLCHGTQITHDDLPQELLDSAQMASIPATPSFHPLSIPEGEKQVIRQALAASGGNMTLAAKQLMIAKSTLYAKLQRYGISR